MYNSKIIEELGKNTAIKIADMIKAFYTYRKPSVIMKGEK